MTITHISDTARWVAFYRARESERPDALFRDPYARRLAGAEGEAIVNRMESRMKGDWPVIVRTAVMDEIILRLVRSGVGTVLNLAAGLDARPWRLDLPATLRWTDVDLPGILDHKLGILAGESTRCAYEAVRLDLTDQKRRRALFARLGAESRETLVITEGLLIYLGAEAVTRLARDLHAMPSCGWWLCDLASPDLLRMMAESGGKGVAQASAPFRFAPDESTAWFGPHGWREAEFRSTFQEGLRLNRTFPMARFWARLSPSTSLTREERIRRFSGIALLAKAG
jgi:methyltransferase (TIGR00027 family)